MWTVNAYIISLVGATVVGFIFGAIGGALLQGPMSEYRGRKAMAEEILKQAFIVPKCNVSDHHLTEQ